VQLWFLNTLVSFPVSPASGAAGVSIVESVARRGDSPPLHVHHDEHEVFHVVEGEMTLLVGEEQIRIRRGQTRLAPKGVPHTYRVDSDQARWLVVTTTDSFERFVRAASRPAERPQLPETQSPPAAEEREAFTELCASYGIELVGPPLDS
jgi:quercetin dioxygenase-like cupin family protein